MPTQQPLSTESLRISFLICGNLRDIYPKEWAFLFTKLSAPGKFCITWWKQYKEFERLRTTGKGAVRTTRKSSIFLGHAVCLSVCRWWCLRKENRESRIELWVIHPALASKSSQLLPLWTSQKNQAKIGIIPDELLSSPIYQVHSRVVIFLDPLYVHAAELTFSIAKLQDTTQWKATAWAGREDDQEEEADAFRRVNGADVCVF